MRGKEVENKVAAANPVDRSRTLGLALGLAEEEMLDAIVAEKSPKPATGSGHQRIRRRPPMRLAFGAAAIFAAAITFFLVSGAERNGSRIQPSSAYAAKLDRNADASPLLLVGAEGWRVDGLQARYQEGEMQFVHGEGLSSELTWAPSSLISLDGRVDDRAYSAALETPARVPGATAKVFRYLGSEPGDLDITALWQDGDLIVEYRARVPTVEVFEAQLASLHKVDTATWLEAMPPGVVKPAEFEATVERMLTGIPLPPGFTAADVMSQSVPTDRYQLGASVVGAVGCTWFARWATARRQDDQPRLEAAIAAMATVDTWPLIRQMEKDGAYGQALIELARAMPRGSVYKSRPLESDIEGALGCGRILGIPIPSSRP